MRSNNRNETIQMQLQSVPLTLHTSLRVAYDLYGKVICMRFTIGAEMLSFECVSSWVFRLFNIFQSYANYFHCKWWKSLTDYASYMYRLDIKSFEFEMCGKVRCGVCNGSVGRVKICKKERIRQRKPKRIGIYGFLTKTIFNKCTYLLLCRSGIKRKCKTKWVGFWRVYGIGERTANIHGDQFVWKIHKFNNFNFHKWLIGFCFHMNTSR